MMRPVDKDMHYKERKMMFFRLKEHDPIGTRIYKWPKQKSGPTLREQRVPEMVNILGK